jgi:hypothetical protein
MDDFWIRQWHQFIFELATNGAAVFLGTLGITVLGLGPIGRAIAARIRGGPAGALPENTLDELRSGMTEMQERLDFSERMLTDVRQKLLEPGKPIEPREPRRVVTPK